MPLVLENPLPDAPLFTTAEAKKHLRVDIADDDTLIDSIVVAVTQAAESYLNRSLIKRTIKLFLQEFPNGLRDPHLQKDIPQHGLHNRHHGRHHGHHLESPGGAPDFISLPRPPLVSITSVKYTVDDGTDDGTEKTFAASNYHTDDKRAPGRIVLKRGKDWPSDDLISSNPVVVEYISGYDDDGSTVPQMIKQAALMGIGFYYENRETIVVEGRITAAVELPMSFKWLLDPFRVVPL